MSQNPWIFQQLQVKRPKPNPSKLRFQTPTWKSHRFFAGEKGEKVDGWGSPTRKDGRNWKTVTWADFLLKKGARGYKDTKLWDRYKPYCGFCFQQWLEPQRYGTKFFVFFKEQCVQWIAVNIDKINAWCITTLSDPGHVARDGCGSRPLVECLRKWFHRTVDMNCICLVHKGRLPTSYIQI